MTNNGMELKACPFCGHKAIYKIEQPRMDSDNMPKYCKCSNGPCCASKIYWPIEQWNTRTPPSGGEPKEAFVEITCRCNSKFGLGLRKNDTEVCTFQDHGHGWAETLRMPLKDSKIPETTPQEIVVDNFKEQP